VTILPGFVARHWQLKISALAMAVLLWTVPRFEAPREEAQEGVTVLVQSNDSAYALLGDPEPPTIRVTLSGPAGELLRVDQPTLSIPIDAVVSMDTTVELTRSMVSIPTGLDLVQVEEMTPTSVRLIFEEIINRALVLVPQTEGTLPDSLSLAGPILVTPEIAVAKGPESRLEGMDSLLLIPLDLGQVQESGAYPQQGDTSGLGLTGLSPAEARIEIQVDSTRRREFPNLQYDVPTLPTGPQIQGSPATLTVTLVGARNLLAAVNPEDIRVKLPPEALSSLLPGQEARVDLVVEGVPPFVKAEVTPGWVTLRRPTGL
jgi:YbbR domain-containing protein